MAVCLSACLSVRHILLWPSESLLNDCLDCLKYPFNDLCVFAWCPAATAAPCEGMGLCQSVHPADHRPGHLRERGGLPGLLQSSK